MKDWCLAHPYLTSVLFVASLLTLQGVFESFMKTFRKPEVPGTVNLNVELPASPPPEEPVSVPKKDNSYN